MKKSDDETDEHYNRRTADAMVYMSFALADLQVVCDRMTEAFGEMGVVMETLLNSCLIHLTAEERDAYDGLVACGTPKMDALCEVERLFMKSKQRRR
jgi:hypothetical protein